MRPSFVIINIMFLAVVAAAWFEGLLAPFLGAGHLELVLLAILAAIFLCGQCCVAIDDLDAADVIAQTLPKIGLVFFGLSIVSFALAADLSSSGGKATFARSVIEAIGINVAAVSYMVWLEILIWALGKANHEAAG